MAAKKKAVPPPGQTITLRVGDQFDTDLDTACHLSGIQNQSDLIRHAVRMLVVDLQSRARATT